MDGGSAENAGAISACPSMSIHRSGRPWPLAAYSPSMDIKKESGLKPLNCTVTLFFWLLSLRGNEHHKAIYPTDYTPSIRLKSNYPHGICGIFIRPLVLANH
jgi:hypothetical protein